MKALDIYEATLCPGCGRPRDICDADQEPIGVEVRICTVLRAQAVQSRLDEAEHHNDPTPALGSPKWDDGYLQVPRHSTPDEIERGRDAASRRNDPD